MIVFDENMSPAFATFLEAIAEPARHVRAMGMGGLPDEKILESMMGGQDCLLTRDRAMLRRAEVIGLLRGSRLGIFILPPKKQSTLETSALVLRHWAHIVEVARKEPRPFVAELRFRGPLRMDRKFGG